MDKYNIITPTSDLDALTADMENWYRLTYNLRRNSNDECIRRYGCTVPDLYNAIKIRVSNNQAMAKVDPDNIVREALELDLCDSFEDYGYRIAMSKQLQDTPWIVILDPDITNREELENKYQQFNNLNQKNRRLSNNYSYQLWGYDVYNMYTIIANKLNNIDIDSNNTISAMEAAIIPKSKANTTNDEFRKFEYYVDYLCMSEDKEYRNVMKNYHNKFIGESSNEVDVFKEAPWFTPDEIYSLGIDINIDHNKSYYTQLKEAKTEEEYLRLGWNPSVSVNEETIHYAKERNFNSILYRVPKDIRNITITENKIPRDRGVIYFVLGYPADFNEFACRVHYNKAGISFGTFTSIYSFTGLEQNFKGFIKESINEYKYVDIVAMFVDKDVERKIKKVCEENIEFTGFNTVYSLLTDFNNEWGDDAVSLMYSQFIDILLRVACTDITGDELTDFNIDNGYLFRVFQGFPKDINASKISSIVASICDEDGMSEYVKSVTEHYKYNVFADYIFSTRETIVKK